MPVLGQLAPYDSLADVTAMTRVVLGDFIEGIQPNVSGVVSTNGTAVTWVSGNPFTYLLVGLQILIAGTPYKVLQVNSATSLTLVGSAGVQTTVNFSAVIPTGDIFADTENYVVPIVNLAWRKVQKKLTDQGHPRLSGEVLLSGIPVSTSLDPASEQWISWDSFFDGTNLQNSPVLPIDFVSPLKLTERLSGFTTGFRMMREPGDGIPSCIKGCWNRFYEWRGDAIYFPGATVLTDMKIDYSAFLPDMVVGTGSTFAQVPVPITRCGDALAYYSAALFVMPRGGEALAPGWEQKGDESINQITNTWAKLQQRQSFHRRAWGERGRRGRSGLSY